MNAVKFDISGWNSLIVINVEVFNGTKNTEVTLALDTGCTQTILRPSIVTFWGLTEKQAIRKIGVTTGSRTDAAWEYQIDGMTVFGFKHKNIRIIAKDLPKGLFIDGLLGLDFFKLIRKKLIIDFDVSTLRLE